MRSDMGKIVTEKARYGHSNPSIKDGKNIAWKGEDCDYGPSREAKSWGRIPYGERKEFSDVLGPLKRWLDKQEGRIWNDVYSEMSKVLDKRKVTHAHVLTHLYSWLELNPKKGKDGRWKNDSYYRPDIVGLYVDPEDGVIRRQKEEVKKTKPKEIKVWELGKLRYYEKLGGVWYYTEYEKMEGVARALHGEYKRIAKRQIGGKELAKVKGWQT